MQLADRRHEAKVANKGPRRFVRARFGGYPVHVLGVEHRVREPIEELITVHRLEKAGTAPSTSNTWRTDSGQRARLELQSPVLSISRANRTSARFAALRAASALGFPSASASSS